MPRNSNLPVGELDFFAIQASGPEAGKAKNILIIPGPDREKHCIHFKISVLEY